MFGMGLGRMGLTRLGRGGGAAPPSPPSYDPAALFALGEDGMFYDPQSINTLWQDAAGTVPVTSDGQLVARIDDRSGNGYHLIQSNPANQYVYRAVDGVKWLDSGNRQCIYDSGKKLTGGLTFAFAVKAVSGATTQQLYDTGASSASAVNSIYFDRSGSSGDMRHYERGESVTQQRAIAGYTGRHFAFVSRLPDSAGNTDFLLFGAPTPISQTARLLGNTTSGSGFRMGPTTGAMDLRHYAVLLIQRVITDVERDSLVGWLAQIGDTETPYIWVGDTQ